MSQSLYACLCCVPSSRPCLNALARYFASSAAVSPEEIEKMRNLLQRVRSEFASRKVVETLSEYVRVPNMSPSFDPDILTNGLQEKALGIMTEWLAKQNLKGCTWKVLNAPERTPLLVVEVEASGECCFTAGLIGD